MENENKTKAFPSGDGYNSGCPNHVYGMDLRDYFAAKAMQGMYAGSNIVHTTDKDLEEDAKLFFRIADAMLKQREI